MYFSRYYALLAFAGVSLAFDHDRWNDHGELDHGEPGRGQHGYGRPPFANGQPGHGRPPFTHGQPNHGPCDNGHPNMTQSQPSNPSQPTNPGQPTNPSQPSNQTQPLNQSQPLQNQTQPVSGSSWPYLPFTTSGRDIVNAAGNKVIYAGVNWPGAAETMLPEGLQYNSVTTIVSKIKSLGMNVIRLTYAIEMIDDHLADSPNSTLKATLSNALGADVGATVLSQILENNPQFTADTTRLQVYDAVAAECAKQEIYVHLDNHVSKAIWCCFVTDGNSWFNDTFFDIGRWQRGLGFMADHAKSWEALASLSLRNELRPAQDGDDSALTYGWEEWYDNMIPAAEGIHSNNSSPLIFLSGLAYDTDDSPLVNKEFTLDGNTHFDPTAFDFSNKLVLELHDYQGGAAACSDITETLYGGGYGAMNVSDSLYYHMPVVLTEFGFGQIDGSSEGVYAQCIKDYLTSLPGGPGGWMQWVLSGSYYIRQGTADYEEVWGLTNHNWTTWRNQTVIDNYVKPFVADTLGL